MEAVATGTRNESHSVLSMFLKERVWHLFASGISQILERIEFSNYRQVVNGCQKLTRSFRELVGAKCAQLVERSERCAL